MSDSTKRAQEVLAEVREWYSGGEADALQLAMNELDSARALLESWHAQARRKEREWHTRHGEHDRRRHGHPHPAMKALVLGSITLMPDPRKQE